VLGAPVKWPAAAVAVLVAAAVGASQLPASASATTPCSSGWVALTFDDGPDPNSTNTSLVLDHLKTKRTPATFFVVGEQVSWWGHLTKRTYAEGHRVENHTWNHPDLTTQSEAGIRDQFVRTNNQIVAAGIPKPRLQRPPYGATNTTVNRIGEELGLTQVLWNVVANDWENPTAAEIRRRVRSQVRPNSIIVILLHDGWTKNTAEAVPGMIDDLRSDGYCFAFMEPDARMEPGVGKIRLVPAEAAPTTAPSPGVVESPSPTATATATASPTPSPTTTQTKQPPGQKKRQR
jgi:peptidoglycan-N-acetylglucosamine deacetylase